MAEAKGSLAMLRRRLEALDGTGRRGGRVLPFALVAIDNALPGKGLALGALHEAAGVGGDEEDGAAAAAFLAGILARTRRPQDVLWAMEEGLKSPVLAAVVGEVGTLSLAASRRLQLAAEASGVTGFALRRWRQSEDAARERGAPNAALTRWRVKALPGDVGDGAPGVGRARWQVELWRCRGGEVPMSWMVEAGDATGHGALAAALADRSATPAPIRAVG